MRGLNSKMVPVGTYIQLFCLILVLVLSEADASPSFRGKPLVNAAKMPKVERTRFAHWGPQNFLGLLPLRSRRNELDNSINPFAAPPPPSFPGQVSPEASAVGESIMEEFVLFLTLKDTGLLEYCMQYK